jgi:ABC-type branched-subunit amino acid transport system substrate-binding protein
MTAPVSILDKKSDYHGPEREEPEPVVEEVRIGFFAPHEAGNLPGQSLWRGAMAAIEEANANEGYHGKPFRLVCRWADNPWGAGSREMTRLVYEDKVWAVIGSIDGAGTHIAEQVATKARITLVSPLSGDPSLTHTAVPWMFRLPPDDSAGASLAL